VCNAHGCEKVWLGNHNESRDLLRLATRYEDKITPYSSRLQSRFIVVLSLAMTPVLLKFIRAEQQTSSLAFSRQALVILIINDKTVVQSPISSPREHFDVHWIGLRVSVRDLNGNLLPFVWTRQSVSNEFENATLLTCEALQKHLKTFIDAGVKENIEILQKVNDPALLVDWVVRTAEHWEVRYAEKRNEKYDISQPVSSAMFEAVFERAWPLLMENFELHEYAALLQRNIETLAEKPVKQVPPATDAVHFRTLI